MSGPAPPRRSAPPPLSAPPAPPPRSSPGPLVLCSTASRSSTCPPRPGGPQGARRTPPPGQTPSLEEDLDWVLDPPPGQTPGLEDALDRVLAALPFLDPPGAQSPPSELFLPVPPSIRRTNQRAAGGPPLFSPSSPPPLDWPLPCSWGPVELKLVRGPRPFHRAHYETEGSRGAVRTASGGHPVVKLQGYSEQALVVQVFMATAEETPLRPHPFYQVHRVTGKSVNTACRETTLDGTRVLEVPLLPENDMTASLDCVGILKLRNADIELRKGDLGRRNTRVRVGYRVHVPQLHGNVLCLQTASVPIECSQRLALELPQVVDFSPASGSVGEEMSIRGTNIFSHSRVIFTHREPDGPCQWEAEASLVPERSSESVLVVRIPPYHNTQARGAVLVHFYVSNGKKRRSQSHSFMYLNAAPHHFLSPEDPPAAPLVKQEGWDYISHNALVLQEPFHPHGPFYKAQGDYGLSLRPPLGSSPIRPLPPPFSIAMTTAYPTAAALPFANQSDPLLRYGAPVPAPPLRGTPPSTTGQPVTCLMERGYWEDAPPPHSLFCQGGAVRVKQEVEESLQEITLDEVNELIDRDFFGLDEVTDQNPHDLQ